MPAGPLTGDGWEHAHAYHYLLKQAAQARFVMIMPDLTDDEGNVSVYQRYYDDNLADLVDLRPQIRAMAFVAFAMVGHYVVKERAR